MIRDPLGARARRTHRKTADRGRAAAPAALPPPPRQPTVDPGSEHSECNSASCFPSVRLGPIPVAVRDYAQAAEELGYDFLVTADHVLGADRERYPDLLGPYGHRAPIHEPLVLFGFLAAVTTRLRLVTNVLILPQRQTALVAKQAAEIDLLSGGRLILGVGNGWNHVEYEALGEDFRTRGRRLDEQVRLHAPASGRSHWSPSRSVSTRCATPGSTPARSGPSRSGWAAWPRARPRAHRTPRGRMVPTPPFRRSRPGAGRHAAPPRADRGCSAGGGAGSVDTGAVAARPRRDPRRAGDAGQALP